MSVADPTNFRQERIEKLLHELRYEVERGLMEREIDETLTFTFIVPFARSLPDGVVLCRFETRPTFWQNIPDGTKQYTRLEVVESG